MLRTRETMEKSTSPNDLSTLSTATIDDLYRSGLTPKTISEMNVLSLTSENYEKYDKISGKPEDGYLIPYHGTTTYARRKNIPAFSNDNGEKPQKYSSPYGKKSHLYILPGDKTISANPKSSIVLIEGEKKTAKVSQELRTLNAEHEKYAAIGVAGVWNFVNCPETGQVHWITFGVQPFMVRADLISMPGGVE